MATASSYYVPICLYPHTQYRTQKGLAALFDKYQLNSHDHLIVVADRLFGLDNLLTGRYWSADAVFDKARREAKQVFSLISKTSHKFGANGNGKIVYWDEIAQTDRYKQFSEAQRRRVLAEPALREALEDFVSRRVERFGLDPSRERERELEREYLLCELCMSVYCTELLDYWVEVWERPPAADIPDLLRLLYEKHAGLLADILGRPPRRVLDFLFD